MGKKEEIKSLKKRNMEIKHKLNHEEVPTNIRDELLNELEENEFMINELMTELKDPKIVPVTGTRPVSDHVYSKKHSSFNSNSFRM